MKTVFMGTPDFAAVVLDKMYEAGYEIPLVITQPDRAKDRGKKVQPTPVKQKAEEHGTVVLQPVRIKDSEETIKILEDMKPDVIVVAAYGQLLPERILKIPRLGCVNVHASLLPKLRGASPIQTAIVRGETKTGVTIMQMARGMDTGDILSRREVEIGNMNGSALHDLLAEVGGELLTETLEAMDERNIMPEPQKDSEATYAPLISKKDGRIDFTEPPEKIERLIRGFDPWPGAFCLYNGQQVRFWKAEVLQDRTKIIEKTEADNAMENAGSTEPIPGTVIASGAEGIDIMCGGGILTVTEIQAAGKKRMAVSEYIKGRKIEPGSLFE